MSAVLWFDVGYIRDTTGVVPSSASKVLWFDVGYIRDTTKISGLKRQSSCGLM